MKEEMSLVWVVAMALMLQSCHVWSGSSNVYPVVLVPGSGGNQLEGRLTEAYRPSSLVCRRWDHGRWFRLWFDPSVIVGPLTKCFAERMTLYYDPAFDDYRNVPGVETRVPYFGSTQSLLYLDPQLKHITAYMAPLVESLEELGYIDGQNLFGAPYDFRYGLAAEGHPSRVGTQFLNNLKRLVENASSSNGGNPVIIISHSLGGLFALHLLNRTTPSWRNKFIKHFIALSAPWGGTVQEMLTFASGYTLGVPLVEPLLVRGEQRSSESNLWLLPSPKLFGRKPLVIVQNRSYSAFDMPEFLEDIGFKEGVYPYKARILPLMDRLIRPEVPVTCIIGSGIKTPETLFYGREGFDRQPDIIYGDGDGTVNMASLLALESLWSNVTRQPFKVTKIPRVSHTTVLNDDVALREIAAGVESFCSAFPTLWVVEMAADSAPTVEQIKRQSLYLLGKTPIEVLFKELKCTKEGLTSEEGANRLQIFGPNKLDEKKESKILKFLGLLWTPHAWVMEFAAIIAIGMDRSGKTPGWEVFMGIAVLLVINSTISFIEENNAATAAAALMAGFSPKAKVLRDGRWSEQEAAILVPGDIISIKSGDIVPADARLLNGDQLMMDESALSGGCFTEEVNPGQVVLSGSTCKQGEIEAVVVATGVHAAFGKVVNSVDNGNQVGHLDKVLTAIFEFCICSVLIAIIIEIIVMFGIQHRNYRDGINNLLVLLIGGIPIAMPTVLSVTMAIGSHRLAEQGAITKRMTAIEEMAGMDVLCSDKTGTLTLNNLSIDRKQIEVFAEGVDKEHMILLAARASKTENQDAVDAAVVGMLADPMEARAGIREVHFLPFNPVDKRTALTYIDANGNWHRASKGSLEQIINLCNCKEDVRNRARALDDKFAKHGLRSLAVASQEVPERTKESAGAPWQFVGLLPLFDPPRPDSVETIRRALNLGVNVKMITGDRLSIARETGRRLGMGTNMYRTSYWLNNNSDEPLVEIPFIHLLEKADGFAVVFPEQKYEIVRQLQRRKHICGMTGDGVNDALALKKADIGIAVAGASDAAINASDIILTEPGLSVIINAVMTSRAIFQRMKNYTIYSVSITIRTILGFLLIALIWKFDFSPFMVLIIAILNDGTIMTIPRDRVKPSPMPDNWKLREIFVTVVVLGGYLALMTVIFFWAMIDTEFFSDKFGVRSLRKEPYEMMAALYLQVSIVSQALIFVTRSRSWSCAERPGLLLASAFIAAQLAATLIAVYANWSFARIKGVGWGWAGVIWLYSLVSYLPLDLIKFFVRDALNGKAPDVSKGKTAFTGKNSMSSVQGDTLHGLHPVETTNLFSDKSSYLVQAETAELA